ncbi:MAG TPA: GTPase ObgE [Candidatus Omnitrophota bacterium]|nr:GTPase ObgE [Candidatus Omnitrophota bacterium]HPB68148.1 GTPase ObgE [Candidatus Omnitrophota bacterium]HQO57096.1 GTPase ObgE [Candidatus Omnitrophota bacterium]HQP11214.1 GTPase ObgE [Candidatus Omnitrophota bacterium]
MREDETMAFVDEARIFVNAGNGGKGCESFYRDKYTRYPRPDGGDGGKGGDIIFEADSHIQTLLDYRYKQHYKADRGGHGGSKGKKGRTAADCVLKIPVGTVIRDKETGLLIRDLTEHGQSIVVAKGGAGGRGNIYNRTPTPPGVGEARTIHLELKLIADVGLIGFPNAGKSTLINCISKVKSKVADYPFTTKAPVLGVVPGEAGSDFVVADLPGLIEGAHAGRGLGDRFLKHAERTQVLVHMIDMAATEGRDPCEDYEKINQEVVSYSDQLTVKEKLVVANKMDLPQSSGNLRRFKRRYPDIRVMAVSAKTGDGVAVVVAQIRESLQKVKGLLS